MSQLFLFQARFHCYFVCSLLYSQPIPMRLPSIHQTMWSLARPQTFRKRATPHLPYAPINVMPAGGGGGGGRAQGGDLTFFKNFQSNSLPTGKSFQSNATKFPHPGLHIAVNPKAEPKKGTIKISLNKTLQSFINVAASPKIHVSVTATIIRFNHNPCYTSQNT